MSEAIKALQEERIAIVKAMRTLIERAEGEKRDFSAEEQQSFDSQNKTLGEVEGRLKRLEDQAALESRLSASAGRAAGGTEPPAGKQTDERQAPAGFASRFNPKLVAQALEGRSLNPGGYVAHELGTALRSAESDPATEARAKAFQRYLLGGASSISVAEARDLQMDADTQGGFLVAPQEFSGLLIQAVNNLVFVRDMATKEVVTQAESLGIPSLDADPADADWTAEVATGSADTAMKFGKRELRPHPLAKRIKISNKLIRASKIGVEAKVIERLAYKFAVTMEKAYLLGTGANQPLGVFIATADGISTGRDVSTGNTSTTIGADNVIETKMSLKVQYWDKAAWMFHRDALKQILKLKDGNGQYLWRLGGLNQGLVAGMPPQLFESPVILSEYVPNTFTSGQYVGILGDFSRYVIVDSLALQFQRLIELYAETNQIGYIGRLETDGMPVLEEAFARVKLG